jgi:hypothetical protein
MSEIEHTTSKSKIEHTNDLCQKLSKQIIEYVKKLADTSSIEIREEVDTEYVFI